MIVFYENLWYKTLESNADAFQGLWHSEKRRERSGSDLGMGFPPILERSKQRHGKIRTEGDLKGADWMLGPPQSGDGHFTEKTNSGGKKGLWHTAPPPAVLFTQFINPDKEESLIVVFCPGFGFSRLVVLHPAVLLYKGIDHFLHGQVRDQLVLGQRAPGHWVKMAYPLQQNTK